MATLRAGLAGGDRRVQHGRLTIAERTRRGKERNARGQNSQGSEAAVRLPLQRGGRRADEPGSAWLQATLKDHRRRVRDLEQDRDALLESMAESVPEALDGLTGEERSRIWRMLRLEVAPTAEGYDVSLALCTSVTPSG